MVKINGKEEDAAGKVLSEYLQESGYSLKRIAVERNGEIVPRALSLIHILYIDELDEEDCVDRRLEKVEKYLDGKAIKPEMEWCGDGVIMMTMMIPANTRTCLLYTSPVQQRRHGGNRTD